MPLDVNDFFCQATMRICGSLNIETAMWETLKYLENFIPLTGVDLLVANPGMATVETVARVTRYKAQKINRILPMPKEIRVDLEREWKNLQDVLIVNQPDDHITVRIMTQLDNMPETSVMIMRLKIQDDRLFAITAHVFGKEQYKKEHAHMLSLLHDPFAIAMSNALKHEEVLKLKEKLTDDNRYLHQEMLRISGDEIIGRDKGLKEVFEMVRQIAPLDGPVLLLGDTGSGKEVIANAIHYFSHRRNEPFIKVNCGAIPESLIDSELFGHEKGAFTGAVTQKRGRFERAHRGTILLDEIGELPLEAQVRLLRVVQNKEIERVGSTAPVPVDIRIIAATHRNLENMVIMNKFREDLWFRLHVFPIKIPPLRDRKEDIYDLIYYFINRKSVEKNIHPTPTVAPEAIERIMGYHWPGNVRELENIVERALIQYQGKKMRGPLTFEDLPFHSTITDSPDISSQNHNISDIDKTIILNIERILKQAINNIKPLYKEQNISDLSGEKDNPENIEKTVLSHLSRIFNQPEGGTILSQTEQSSLQSNINTGHSIKLDDAISLHIQKVVKMANGKIHGPGGAAELLCINPSTLRFKMKKLGLL
ncbi:MAG: sigma 54-interacting transcriptional regulator [Pseudomonadota bacterium]